MEGRFDVGYPAGTAVRGMSTTTSPTSGAVKRLSYRSSLSFPPLWLKSHHLFTKAGWDKHEEILHTQQQQKRVMLCTQRLWWYSFCAARERRCLQLRLR